MEDPLRTVISQYAQSPSLGTLIVSENEAVDPVELINAFYRDVFNVDTAKDFGLDAWGRIVGVGRVLQVAQGKWFGFAEAGNTSADPWNQSAFYNGQSLTSAHILANDGFRTLIMAKAAANICDGSIQGINNVLLRLFPGRGNTYVTDPGDMTLTFIFTFAPTPVEVATILQSGVLPTPTGVSWAVAYQRGFALESQHGDHLDEPAIVDGRGVEWSIVMAAEGVTEVTHNGVPDPSTAGVVEIYYLGGVVYYADASGRWWAWTGTSWFGPVASPVPLTDIRGVVSAGVRVTANAALLRVGAQAGIAIPHGASGIVANPAAISTTTRLASTRIDARAGVIAAPAIIVTSSTHWTVADPQVTIDATGLIATKNDWQGYYTPVVADHFVTSGKYYWEIALTTVVAASDIGVGIATPAFVQSTDLVNNLGYLGAADGQSWGWYSNIPYDGLGMETYANVGTADMVGFQQGNILCIALDMVNLKWWARVNGGAWLAQRPGTQNPATGTGGLAIPSDMGAAGLAPAIVMQAIGDQMTARFAAGSWGYAAPAGFNQI